MPLTKSPVAKFDMTGILGNHFDTQNSTYVDYLIFGNNDYLWHYSNNFVGNISIFYTVNFNLKSNNIILYHCITTGDLFRN